MDMTKRMIVGITMKVAFFAIKEFWIGNDQKVENRKMILAIGDWI